jgi:Protein of unknown function (DUF433)
MDRLALKALAFLCIKFWECWANGDTIDDLLEDYPSLMQEDIFSCLAYAALLAEEQVTPFEELSGTP